MISKLLICQDYTMINSRTQRKQYNSSIKLYKSTVSITKHMSIWEHHINKRNSISNLLNIILKLIRSIVARLILTLGWLFLKQKLGKSISLLSCVVSVQIKEEMSRRKYINFQGICSTERRNIPTHCMHTLSTVSKRNV